MSQLNKRDRCDHCKKFVSSKHQSDIYNLEGLVSDRVDSSFNICGQCIEKHQGKEYWDDWVLTRSELPVCIMEVN